MGAQGGRVLRRRVGNQVKAISGREWEGEREGDISKNLFGCGDLVACTVPM